MVFAASPLRYPGGKAGLSPLIRDLLIHNDLRHCVYAEPFAGGGGLALKLLFDGLVSRICLNDLDPAIWSFWHSVLDRSDELVALIQSTDVTLDEWRRQREIMLAGDSADPLRLGFATFFLNRTNRSGIIKSGGVIGGLDQRGAYKLDCRFNKDELSARIRRIAQYRRRIALSNLDAIDFLDHFERTTPRNALLYVDPPYFSQGSALYSNFYRRADHAILAKRVQAIAAPWVLTYDDAPEIAHLYAARRVYRFDLVYSAQMKRTGTELLVLSDGLDAPLSVAQRLRAAV